MREFRIGSLGGLSLTAAPSAVIASALAVAALWAAGYLLLGLGAGGSLVFALAAGAMHWTMALMHHLGHAWAARRASYPMRGIRLWALMGCDLYPGDEPALPAATHIRRAVGGPLVSLGVLVAASVALLATGLQSNMPGVLVAWWWLDSLILTLGGLIPLGFTDADTLIYWWPRR